MKLIVLHETILNETILLDSFNDDCKIIKERDFNSVDDLINSIDDFSIYTHLCFIYHYPGYCSLPFFTNTYIEHNIDSLLNINNFNHLNKNIIKLIKNFKTVDILSCNLNDKHFIEEIEKIENELNINIRYSLDQTGNNPNGDWILESDNIDIKDIYFNENINKWKGILTAQIDGNNLETYTENGTPFVSVNNLQNGGKKYTLLRNIVWSDISGINFVPSTSYITLGPNDIFDGSYCSIDLSGLFTDGLFAIDNSGVTINDIPQIYNLGILNGSLNDNSGFIIRQFQKYFKINNCFSTGNISGIYSGGICGTACGYNGSCTITDCFTTGNIFGSVCGNICGSGPGYSGFCLISNSYSIGDISGDFSGGICSYGAGVYGLCNIINCYTTGNIIGSGCGGICGIIPGFNGLCNISNCYSTGNIISNNSGGICGVYDGTNYQLLNSNWVISNCYAKDGDGTNPRTFTGNSIYLGKANFQLNLLNKLDPSFNFIDFNTYLNSDTGFYYDPSINLIYPQLLLLDTFYKNQLLDSPIVQKNIDFNIVPTNSQTDFRHQIITKLMNYYTLTNFYIKKESLGLINGPAWTKTFDGSNNIINVNEPSLFIENSVYVNLVNNGNQVTFINNADQVNVIKNNGYYYINTDQFTDGSSVNIFNGSYTLYFGGVQAVANIIPCLTEDTQVLTPNGYKNISELNKGDLVVSENNRIIPIIDIYSSIVYGNIRTFPYMIPANSISKNYPPKSIKLSGGHLIKYNNKWIQPMANKLLKRDTSKKIIKYYHIKLPNYETDNLIINNGTIVESLGDSTKDLLIYNDRINNSLKIKISDLISNFEENKYYLQHNFNIN